MDTLTPMSPPNPSDPHWTPPSPPSPSSSSSWSSKIKKWHLIVGAIVVIIAVAVFSNGNESADSGTDKGSTGSTVVLSSPSTSAATTLAPTTMAPVTTPPVETRTLLEVGGPALSDWILTRAEYAEWTDMMLMQGVNPGGDAALAESLGMAICSAAADSYTQNDFASRMMDAYYNQTYYTVEDVATIAAGLMLYMCYDEAVRLGYV